MPSYSVAGLAKPQKASENPGAATLSLSLCRVSIVVAVAAVMSELVVLNKKGEMEALLRRQAGILMGSVLQLDTIARMLAEIIHIFVQGQRGTAYMPHNLGWLAGLRSAVFLNCPTLQLIGGKYELAGQLTMLRIVNCPLVRNAFHRGTMPRCLRFLEISGSPRVTLTPGAIAVADQLRSLIVQGPVFKENQYGDLAKQYDFSKTHQWLSTVRLTNTDASPELEEALVCCAAHIIIRRKILQILMIHRRQRKQSPHVRQPILPDELWMMVDDMFVSSQRPPPPPPVIDLTADN